MGERREERQREDSRVQRQLKLVYGWIASVPCPLGFRARSAGGSGRAAAETSATIKRRQKAQVGQ